MLICHQWGSVAFNTDQIRTNCLNHNSLYGFKNYSSEMADTFPRVQWVRKHNGPWVSWLERKHTRTPCFLTKILPYIQYTVNLSYFVALPITNCICCNSLLLFFRSLCVTQNIWFKIDFNENWCILLYLLNQIYHIVNILKSCLIWAAWAWLRLKNS